MDFGVFLQVAETVFPFLACIELNSQGDPLLYPRIDEVLETIRHHNCDVKVQTNGTLFTKKNVDFLASMHGEVNLSIDAVGEKFDEVRKGGIWSKAEPGICALLTKRDPERLTVGFYPTVTARTVDQVLPVVKWAAAHGVDRVAFHRYAPLPDGWSIERSASDEDLAKARTSLLTWLDRNPGGMTIFFDGEQLNKTLIRPRRLYFASPEKEEYRAKFNYHETYPLEAGNPEYICTTPNGYIEIGLDGQISACCRSQDVSLGYATSVEQFAEAWFGYNYALLRNSLKRSNCDDFPLAQCEGCIAFYAPGTLKGRKAMSYADDLSDRKDGLHFPVKGKVEATKGKIVIDRIRQVRGAVFVGTASSAGMLPREPELTENGVAFAPAAGVDNLQPGQFYIGGSNVFFSTLDMSDPTLNGRTYALETSRRSKKRFANWQSQMVRQPSA